MQNSKLSFKKFKPLHDKSRTSGVLQAIYLFLVPKFKCKGNINLDPLPPPHQYGAKLSNKIRRKKQEKNMFSLVSCYYFL